MIHKFSLPVGVQEGDRGELQLRANNQTVAISSGSNLKPVVTLNDLLTETREVFPLFNETGSIPAGAEKAYHGPLLLGPAADLSISGSLTLFNGPLVLEEGATVTIPDGGILTLN